MDLLGPSDSPNEWDHGRARFMDVYDIGSQYPFDIEVKPVDALADELRSVPVACTDEEVLSRLSIFNPSGVLDPEQAMKFM